MPRSTVPAAAVALTLLIAACASSGAPKQPRANQAELTTEEIQASSATNAYELIQSLRPRWLHDRGQQTLATTTQQTATGPVTGMVTTSIVVYVDGARRGNIEELRTISARDLRSARRLNAGEATRLYGGGHPHGAILLTTR